MLSVLRRVVVVLALCVACRTAAPPVARPEFFPAPSDGQPPVVGVVLGGGGARGFAHVGVLRVLEQHGIPVELIVGTSVGSLVGALYAGDMDSRELERIARTLERHDVFDFGIAPALFSTGLASGNRLERFVRDHATSERIEGLRIPYAAVATDLDSGEVVVLRSGDLARAVRASSAIPGVFQPVEIDRRLLVDGGVAQNLPVRVARSMGADVVIAVDVTAIGAAEKPPRNFVEVILRAVNIVVHGEVEEARRDADVLITPEVAAIGFIDFDRKVEAMAAGIAAATAAMPRIRRALDQWRPAPRPGGVPP